MPPSPKKRRWNLWIIIPCALAGILAILILTPLAAVYIWSSGRFSEANRLITEIDSRGEPLLGEQLPSYFPLQAGVEDATAIWIEALAPLDTHEFKTACLGLPFVGGDSQNVPPPLGEPWAQLEACEAFLAANAFSLEKIHEATRRGGYARFPVDCSRGFINLKLSHADLVRAATRLLRLEFEVKIRRGDLPGAMNTLRALFSTSRCLKDEPILISQLIVSAIDGVAKSALAEKLCLIQFAEADLRAIQDQLRKYDRQGQMRCGLIGERAIGHSAMRNQSLADPKLPAKPAWASDVAFHLKYMTRFIAAMDKPFPAALDEVAKIDAEIEKESRGYAAFTHMLSNIYVPATGAVFEAVARNIATDRAADAGIAAELYRRETGKLPPSLDALVPKFLPAVPVDPYSGKPLLYKLDEKGFTIYSVGKNRADDGGRFDFKTGDEGLFFPVKP